MDDSPVRVYADYACPFCYLTHHNVETLRAGGHTVDFDWHPYDLRAERRDTSGRLDPTRIQYPAAVAQRIDQLRNEAGAKEMLPVQEVPKVDSFNAQLLSLYSQAEHPDLWADIDAGLFEALWQNGRDIADADVLTDIAVTAGVDASTLPAALGDEQLRDRLSERFAAARRNGVTDVPTFVTESRTIAEYLPAEELQQLFSAE
ncbi:DsbA family protein [Halovenus rubra]|jgi:predicted DsbA family dithiol-disulfide isomerase|uniref:DsbA family protein n=2 Tax=Halovenus rubra TaxID=869890 RepID=A0ACC7E404_9EURY|nr:DsbA family protein [Halovenus rubra]